jgi:ankyrin repeat protein
MWVASAVLIRQLGGASVAQGGGTALIFAAAYGHAAVVSALLEGGANAHVMDKARAVSVARVHLGTA